MIVMTQTKETLVNLDGFKMIFIGKTDYSIYAIGSDSNARFCGRYTDMKLLKDILEDIQKALIRDEKLYIMPSFAEAKEKFNKTQQKQPWHHATGKKLKRHGGS